MAKNVYKVHLKRVVESYVVVEAENEEDAADMCLIGIAVKENGNLDARSDMKDLVLDYGVEAGVDTLDEYNGVQDVTEEWE